MLLLAFLDNFLDMTTRGSNSDASNMTPTATSAGSRRPLLVKRPTAEALSLDKLVREGPPDGDLVGALESTRLKILDQGIKSDGDGMVLCPFKIRRI